MPLYVTNKYAEISSRTVVAAFSLVLRIIAFVKIRVYPSFNWFSVSASSLVAEMGTNHVLP